MNLSLQSLLGVPLLAGKRYCPPTPTPTLILLLHFQAVCRNSFQSLMRPDITKVELLKDVESKQDLILRLVAHDIEDNQPGRAPHLGDLESDGEEQVLKEHRSFYFEVPPAPKRRESSHSTVSKWLREGRNAAHSCVLLAEEESPLDPQGLREGLDQGRLQQM